MPNTQVRKLPKPKSSARSPCSIEKTEREGGERRYTSPLTTYGHSCSFSLYQQRSMNLSLLLLLLPRGMMMMGREDGGVEGI